MPMPLARTLAAAALALALSPAARAQQSIGTAVEQINPASDQTTTAVKRQWCWAWSSNDTPATAAIPLAITLPATIVIDSLSGYVSGSATPTLAANVSVNGTTLAGCGAVTIPAAGASAACSGGSATVSAGGTVDINVTATSGTVAGPGIVCANYHVTAP